MGEEEEMLLNNAGLPVTINGAKLCADPPRDVLCLHRACLINRISSRIPSMKLQSKK